MTAAKAAHELLTNSNKVSKALTDNLSSSPAHAGRHHAAPITFASNTS